MKRALTVQLRLQATDKSGATKLQQLESVARQTKRSIEELRRLEGLEEVAVAPRGRYLLELFNGVHAGRQYTGMGIAPLSWQDLAAYTTVTGHKLEPWELEAVRALDEVLVRETNKHGPE